MNQNLDINSCVVSTHFFYASLWSQTFEFYTSAKREPGCFLPIFFPTKLLPVAVGTFFFPTSCLDRNGVKQHLERFCLKESINLVELLGLIPSSSSSLQRFQTQQIDPFKTGQTLVLEFLGEQLLHDAEKKPSLVLFVHIHHLLTSPLESSPLESSLAAVEKVKPLIIHQFSKVQLAAKSMPIRGAIDPFLGKCRIYIFCLVVFSQPKI